MSLWDAAGSVAAPLTKEIEAFVRQNIGEIPTKKAEPKIIHDAVHGTHTLEGWETAVLDTPLMQRLRHIQQTSHAFLTYPSARHDRFQHSLGVRMGAERILRKLSLKHADLFPQSDRLLVLLAALVHDCGHGFGSHISEDVYGVDPDLLALRELDFLKKASPHERLSFLIVLSPPFEELIRQLEQLYSLDPVDLELVGRMIVGSVDDPEKFYLGEIINGPFDADKMDYFLRDSHFTGIPLAVDLERLLAFVEIEILNPAQHVEEVPHQLESSNVLQFPNRRERHLVLGVRGVSAVEQMIFNRFVLTSSIYQHHKVRAADVLMVRLVETIRSNGETIAYRKLERPVDFLEVADGQVWFNSSNNPDTSDLTRRLRYRDLPKRALVLSRTTVASTNSLFHGLSPKTQEVQGLKQKIEDAIFETAAPLTGQALRRTHVWFDIPKGPQYADSKRCFVRQRKGRYSLLSDVAKVSELKESFNNFKYRGHVFTVEPFRSEVSRAAKEVLEDLYEIRINNSAVEEAKLS